MGNYKKIEFDCLQENCRRPVVFRFTEIEKGPSIKCSSCGREYIFNGSFVDRMRKFDNLISAIRDAKDILGDTNVAVNIEEHAVRIPYRLLLTRMNTLFSLSIGNQKVEFKVRVEPLEENGQTFKNNG